MRKLQTLALALALALFAVLGFAQQKDKVLTRVETKQPTTGEKMKPTLMGTSQTGYGVSINNPESNTSSALNPSQSPIVIASCNATVAPKDIEAWVGQNNPTTVQNMVASLSGTGRQTITFVVPWGWYYYINVSQQPNIGGIPPGGVCRATAWWTTN